MVEGERMTNPDDSARTRPDGSAYQAAQRAVADRNEETKKVARQQRDTEERDLAKRKAKREQGVVYR
jgi:hypothetical protein